jgi:hypothetical protein
LQEINILAGVAHDSGAALTAVGVDATMGSVEDEIHVLYMNPESYVECLVWRNGTWGEREFFSIFFCEIKLDAYFMTGERTDWDCLQRKSPSISKAGPRCFLPHRSLASYQHPFGMSILRNSSSPTSMATVRNSPPCKRIPLPPQIKLAHRYSQPTFLRIQRCCQMPYSTQGLLPRRRGCCIRM